MATCKICYTAVFTTGLIQPVQNKHSKNTTCSLEARQGHRSSKQSRILSKVKRNILSDMSTNITEMVIRLIALENQLISVVEDQGFLHHLTTCRMCASFVGLIQQSMQNRQSRRCWTRRQATCPRHFMWQRKKYEKSKGWYGGTKHGLRLTHTSAGSTWRSAVTVQRHTLTC